MNPIDFYYFQDHAIFFVAIYVLLLIVFIVALTNFSLFKRLEKERLLNEQQKADLIKFKLAVQNVYDVIFITDGNGKSLYANKMFEKITGYYIGEVVGLNIKDALAKILPTEFFEKMWRSVARENRDFSGETIAKHKNSDEYSLKVNLTPIFDEYGKIVFVVGIMRDITKEKEINQAKSDFVSIVSHQLRTPLTIIKGYVSMLKESGFGSLNEQQNVILDKVYESNEHLINLVQDLLNMSRIEAGRIKYNYEVAQLEDVVAGLIEEFSIAAKDKGLYLKYEAPATPLPKVSLDKEKIRQVIMNIIDNSIKYTPQGGITIKLSSTGQKVLFQVVDTGLGIKDEEMENLFAKYSRGSDDSSKTKLIKGTGLGLYVGKIMVEAHKGTIGATSEGENKGSTFYFELPVAK